MDEKANTNKNPFIMDEDTFVNGSDLPLIESQEVPELILAMHMARVLSMDPDDLSMKKQHNMFVDREDMDEICESCNTRHGVIMMTVWYRSEEHAAVVTRHLREAAEEMAALDRRMDNGNTLN